MLERHLRFVSWALLGCALATAPARAYVADDRWNSTATDGATGAKGTPVTVTWSFAPDGTTIPSASSNLIAFLDLNFGAGDGGSDYTLRPWFTHFDQAFSRLGQVAGVTYVYEPHDDGMPFASLNRGILGVRGDVRLSGKSYGPGDSTLASNFFPDYAEMMINTDQGGFLSNPVNGYRPLRNTLMHELMHGLGMSHVDSSDARFLIEPTLGTSFDGPQLDDILGLQRLYGDVLEKNGGNDSAGSATPLGSLAAGGSIVRGTLGDSTVVPAAGIDFLSIDDDSDVDFFSFTLSQPLAVAINLTPKGATYQIAPFGDPQSSFNTRALSDLSLALFDAVSGVQLGATANSHGLGLGESIVRELNAGAYLARVTGAHDEIQLYQIALNGTAIAPETVSWAGGATGVWDVDDTPSFTNGAGPDVFRNGDSVTFGDGVPSTVTVAEPVAPAAMTVTSTNDFVFTGAAITTNLLTVAGGGTVTLATAGNHLSSVNVTAGVLQLSGVNDAPLAGGVHVAAGAALELVQPQTFTATTHVSGGGVVVGPATIPGEVAPGDSIGVLTFSDDLSLTSTSRLAIEIGGGPGLQNDVLNVLGDAVLNGQLSVTLVSGFTATLGATYSIVTAQGTLTGAFATESLPDLGLGLEWHTTYLPHEVVLAISAAAAFAAADFNEDGFVDADDLAVWRLGMGTVAGATRAQGDANGDGAVNGADFLIWQRQLIVAGPNSGMAPSVPEPTGLGLGLVGLGAFAGRQWRRKITSQCLAASSQPFTP